MKKDEPTEIQKRMNADVTEMDIIDEDRWIGKRLAVDEQSIAEMEKRIDLRKRIKTLFIRCTRERDWIIQGKEPYLQITGSTAAAEQYGNIRWTPPISEKRYDEDELGRYYIWEYRATFIDEKTGVYAPANGACSSRDNFFGSKGGKFKPLSEVDEPNIMRKAHSNMVNRGLKTLLGLMNVSWEELEDSGLDVKKIMAGKRIDYKTSKKQESKPATQHPQQAQGQSDPTKDEMVATVVSIGEEKTTTKGNKYRGCENADGIRFNVFDHNDYYPPAIGDEFLIKKAGKYYNVVELVAPSEKAPDLETLAEKEELDDDPFAGEDVQ